MTRPDVRYRDRRRELERELSDVPAPPPPADLLDAIRRDIPADLETASEPAGESPAVVLPRPWWRTTSLRLAAAVAFVALGAAVMLRLSDGSYLEVDDRAGVATETQPLALPEEAASAPAEAKEVEVAGAEPPMDGGPSVRALQYDTELARRPAAPAEGRESRGVVAESPPQQSPAGNENGAPGDAPTGVAGGVAGGASSTVEESITVTSQAPMVDKFNVTSGATVSNSDKGDRKAAKQAKQEPRDAIETRSQESAVIENRLIVSAADVPARSLRRDVPTENRSRVLADVAAPAPAEVPPSTGGTTEPNDAPVGDMFFRTAGTNPFVDTAEDAQSTFALDVDTGSWTLTRSYLERGALPPPEAIRVEEFVNAQEYDDPAPRRGEFTLIAEGAPSPFAPAGDYRVLRFAVKGREIDASDRKPSILTFVIDVSGSMAQGNRLVMVKRALGMLLDELRPEDRVALVVYGTNGRVLLDHTSDHERIRWAIESLHPEGSTNAEEGLRLGYDLAGSAYRTGRNNRIVLCSDGVANVGLTGPESILERIGNEARRGIELTTVGFGMGNYNDVLMEQLADRGDGRYHYVDTLDEAQRIFRENLSGTLETIAKDAKVQVEFDPRTVERWRLLGYENRDVADRDFRNDSIDAGEIGAGHSATAVYEVRLAPGAARSTNVLGTLRLRWHSVATGQVEEAALPLRPTDLDRSFATASPNLRRAAVTAELAEILEHSFYAKEASWRVLRDEVHRLDDEPAPARRSEDLRWMIDRAAELSETSP